MKSFCTALAAVAALALAAPAHALILSVGNNTGGLPGMIIAPPADVGNSAAGSNTHQLGFNEAQNVLLPVTIASDQGPFGPGGRYNSHMIFLNILDVGAGTPTGLNAINDWTFDGPIVATMSNTPGTFEAGSNLYFAAGPTTYPGAFPARGLETGQGLLDNLSLVNSHTLRVNMNVQQPGDWVRVITLAVPEPLTASLGMLGMGALGIATRRRKMA